MENGLVDEIEVVIDRYQGEVAIPESAIGKARSYSQACLDKIIAEIESSPPSPELGVVVMAVAGSLARLEASESSDIDLMIVISPQTDKAVVEDRICEWRDNLCARLGLEKPNRKGVFAKPVCLDDLKRVSGEAGEAYETTAKRTLFLLESTCVFGEDAYNSLIETIIGHFVEDVSNDPSKNFVFLINDVVRYFRALCVNYQYTKQEIEYGKWPIRNVKLRHSRVLMYFSMILGIGYLSQFQEKSKVDGLKRLVAATPLERVYAVYALSGEAKEYGVVAASYGTFLEALSEKSVRRELENLDYERRYESAHFKSVKSNSDRFAAELTRFYRARENEWDARFFEYMIL